MLFKVFNLVFNPAQGGISDEAVQNFIKDKEIISINEYLIVRNEIHYLIVTVKYYPYRAEGDAGRAPPQTKTDQPKKDDWRAMLSDSDMGLFNLLRDWRTERYKKDGVSAYVVATDRELAMIVKKRPQSLTELGQVEGIGPGKLQKYGDEILKITKIDGAPNNDEQLEVPDEEKR